MTKFTRITQSRRKLLKPPKFLGRFKLNKERISISIFLALLILGFVYLALINNVSTGGFELKRLEQRVEVLKEENEKLELEVAKLQSMNVIARASAQLELVETEKVEYLELTPPYIALGR